MNINKTKIAIIGNSVTIKMRPKRLSKIDKTFAELLSDDGYQIHNYGRAGSIITESFRYLDDEVISIFPNYLIVVYGVVEAFPRRTFRYLNNFNIINYYNNKNFRRNYVSPGKISTVRIIVRLINGFVRKLAGLLRLQWFWLSQRVFADAVEAMCTSVLSETSSDIIIVGISKIAQGSGKYTRETESSINAFNSILMTQAARSSRVSYIDVTASLSEEQLIAACPDGIHFSASGHRLLYEAIKSILESKARHLSKSE